MKDHPPIDYRDCDRQIWEEELSEFLPHRILDAHIHFFWASDFPVPPPQGTRDDAGLATLNDWARVLYPGRRMEYLILGMDEWNLADLAEYTTKRYPGIKWLLAHCARSFTYWPIRQAVERLRDLPNIHYDTSAVTDVRPYITLLTKEDPKRIFWGSDGVGAAFCEPSPSPCWNGPASDHSRPSM